MSEAHCDFAVFGSTPLARLVAGLLTEAHGKSVVRIGPSDAAYRLIRGIDLSAAPVTRPETWRVLTRSEPELHRLLGRIGARRAISRLDPLFVAESSEGRPALNHFRHMASAFGRATERAPGQSLANTFEGFILRDCALLDRQLLEPLLDRWFARVGGLTLAEAEATMLADGGARIVHPDRAILVDKAVLVDDDAILRHAALDAAGDLLRRGRAVSLLTEPARPLEHRLRLQLEGGATALQRPGLAIAALACGNEHRAVNRIGRLLHECTSLRRAGQSSHPILDSMDGAGISGRIRKRGPTLIGGFGPIGAFLAPVIAQWLAGSADRVSTDFFAARSPDRRAAGSHVADISTSVGSELESAA